MSEQPALNADSGTWRDHLAAAHRVLRQVNTTTGDSWRLDSRFATGALEGAWRVRHGSVVAVLKWHEPSSDVPYNADAPAIVAYLRSAGYPTPAWLASGVFDGGGSWSLQEFVDGEPLRELDLASAELFVDLVRLQRTLALPTGMGWNPYIREHAFGDHRSTGELRAANGEVRHLVEDVLALAAPFRSAPLTESDMVHVDLNVSNLLLRDGRLVAVVDVDGAGLGCAAYDLLSPVLNALVWDSDPEAIERLVACALDAYTGAEVAVVTACLTVEIGCWYLGRNPARFQTRAPALRRWVTDFASRVA